MRFTFAVTTSVIAFGAFLGGIVTSSDASQTVQQHAAASGFRADVVVLPKTEEDHGNG
ncbi:hypothetical protein AB0F11_09705 [Streptomyces sp. NPDC032472]|uniref:hypothetical protein n=1 Tax=Streptomyces sp. NPDC032472 TaxID=3155018 RepID=UPI0033C909F2